MFDLVMNNECDLSQVTWEITIAHRIAPWVEGSVSMSGMSWWKNGAPQGRGTAYQRSAYGRFHGTFAPLKTGDEFRIATYISYQVASVVYGIPGGTASVNEFIGVSFRLVKSGGPSSFVMGGSTTLTSSICDDSAGATVTV